MRAAYPHVALRVLITNDPDLFAGAGSQKLVGVLTQICHKLHEEERLPDKIDVPSKFTHVTLVHVLKDVQRQIALHQDRRKRAPARQLCAGQFALTKLRYSLQLPAIKS